MTDISAFRDCVARTLFVTAWADWMDEYGPGTPGNGCDLMKEAPETPAYVYESADELIAQFEEKIAPLGEIFKRARKTWTNTRPASKFIDELAYSMTMSSLGHGVNWADCNDHFEGCRGLVYFGFTYCDLDDETYPIPEEHVSPAEYTTT